MSVALLVEFFVVKHVHPGGLDVGFLDLYNFSSQGQVLVELNQKICFTSTGAKSISTLF